MNIHNKFNKLIFFLLPTMAKIQDRQFSLHHLEIELGWVPLVLELVLEEGDPASHPGLCGRDPELLGQCFSQASLRGSLPELRGFRLRHRRALSVVKGAQIGFQQGLCLLWSHLPGYKPSTSTLQMPVSFSDLYYWEHMYIYNGGTLMWRGFKSSTKGQVFGLAVKMPMPHSTVGLPTWSG